MFFAHSLKTAEAARFSLRKPSLDVEARLRRFSIRSPKSSAASTLSATILPGLTTAGITPYGFAPEPAMRFAPVMGTWPDRRKKPQPALMFLRNSADFSGMEALMNIPEPSSKPAGWDTRGMIEMYQ